MTDTITLTGIVATPPKDMRTNSGLSICSFRLASSQRRYDRGRNEWVDGETNWYTVTAFRHLADNIAKSLAKGEHVVVLGRLRVRAWESSERSGTTVEVDADAIEHDLLWGTTAFTRVAPVRAAPAPEGQSGTGPAESPAAAGAGLGTGFPPAAALAPSPGPGLLPAAVGVADLQPDTRSLVPSGWPEPSPAAEPGAAAASTAAPGLEAADGAASSPGAESSWHDAVETPF